LNVALTRAKKKLVLIGAIDTLRSSPALADAHELLKREGWITPVTNESLDHAKRLLEKY
jgi:superfamily I DNA and/or RNA helicase